MTLLPFMVSYKYNSVMPMTNDSAHLFFNKDARNNGIKSPRQSSLAFIRQFSRIYTYYGSPLIGVISAN
ncbi:MAG: hypothetical protein K2G52_12840 [Muribaculaceae bacterium]|nr:hypothetical protein [Muribaculaceae bacterium]